MLDETDLMNDRTKKLKAQLPHRDEPKMKGLPKFGMPMEEFKALLNKDDRIPKLKDKRQVMQAMQKKLECAAKVSNLSNEHFKPSVYIQALNEAIKEQVRISGVA